MKVQGRLMQARFIKIQQVFSKKVSYFSNNKNPTRAQKQYLTQMLFAINWR
jgi:hypothetical protein